jgi:hypothetical protein
VAELLLFVALAVGCGGIGLPLSRAIPSQYRWRILTAPTLGIALLAVVVTVGYRYGATIPSLLAATLIASAVLGFFGVRAVLRDAGSARSLRGLGTRFAALWLTVATVLLAPHWVGGNQFSVFQGNNWDTFGYLNSALVYAREPCARLVSASRDDLLRNPLWATAQQNLRTRPAVHLLYGMFSSVAPGDSYRLYYSFLVFFLSQFTLVALFVLRNALRDASTRANIAIAVAFPLGFWGQYIFDINSWSQIVSLPVLFLLSCLCLHAAVASNPHASALNDLRVALVLGLLVAGGLYLYPENLTYHLLALVPSVLVMLVVRQAHFRRQALRTLLPILGVVGGLATGVLCYESTLGFAVQQVTGFGGTTTIVNWWRFFQGFFGGRDSWNADLIRNTIDFAGGFFGLYFLTPPPGAGAALAIGLRLVVVLIIAGVGFALGRLLSSRSSGNPLVSDIAPASRSFLIAVGLLVGAMFLPPLYWCTKQNYWPAGKAVSYASPAFMTLLAVPLAYTPLLAWDRVLRWIVGVFVTFQIGIGVARIGAAGRSSGIHYAPPYPSVQDLTLKTQMLWEMDRLKEPLRNAKRVFVEPTNAWQESYLAAFLYTQGIEFFSGSPILSSFSVGENLGVSPARWPVDASVAANEVITVRFSDGRPTIVIERRRRWAARATP